MTDTDNTPKLENSFSEVLSLIRMLSNSLQKAADDIENILSASMVENADITYQSLLEKLVKKASFSDEDVDLGDPTPTGIFRKVEYTAEDSKRPMIDEVAQSIARDSDKCINCGDLVVPENHWKFNNSGKLLCNHCFGVAL